MTNNQTGSQRLECDECHGHVIELSRETTIKDHKEEHFEGQCPNCGSLEFSFITLRGTC